MRNLSLAFVLGLLSGVLCFWAGSRYLGPRLPALLGGPSAMEATVTAERLDAGRLLLTLNTPDQAVLATFAERVAELDLLIDVGDAVTVRLPRDQPFVEDPPVLKVRKGEAAADPVAADPAVEDPAVDEPTTEPANPDDASGGELPASGDGPESESFEDGTYGQLDPTDDVPATADGAESGGADG